MSEKITNDKDVIYDLNEDINVQVVKLIRSFFYKRKLYEKGLDVDEFVNVAYELFLIKDFINKYNESFGKLSTYVYYILDKYYVIVYYELRYNLSYRLAFLLYKNSTTNIDRAARLLNINNSYTSLNQSISGTKKLSLERDKNTYEEVIPDPDETGIDKYLYNQNLKDKLTEVTNFIKNEKKFTEQQKNIIFSFMRSGGSFTETAKSMGCSRQNVHRVVEKFKRLSKVAGLTYYS